MGHGRSSPYAVSKAAVNGLTMALSQELGKHGVRVVGLAPGFIATDLVLAGLDAAAQERLLSLQALPVQRAGGYRGDHRLSDLARRAADHGRDDRRRSRDNTTALA